MAGNRQIYEQAMDAGNNFFFDQNWEKASTAYARAIQELPEDPEAHMGLGISLLELHRFQDALKVFERGAQLAPDNAGFHERAADVLERLGRLQEAASRYVQVADIYLGQHDLEKAIGNWERATRLTPGLLQIHYRLGQAYERTGQKKQAVREYLVMAFNFQRLGDKDKALQAIERARRIEPSNVQVTNADQAIRSGALIVLPEMDEQQPDKESKQVDQVVVAAAPAANPEGPIGEATENAMAELAEIVFSDLSPATAHAIQGIEQQKVGDVDGAIDAYHAAENAGMKYPALFMCMSYMYLAQEGWVDAQRYLEKAMKDPNYAAGAAQGLGIAFMGLKQQSLATMQLITALKLVDTSLALSTDEATELNVFWDSLLKNMRTFDERDLYTKNQNFLQWLSGPDWKVNIAETRRILAAEYQKGGETGDINVEMAKMVRDIDTYIKQNLLQLAMDTAFRAIEIEPIYLPAHQRVAQILMEEGRTQASIVKYNIVADSFLARNDISGASKILNEVIKVAPMDIGLRTSLIELLERENKTTEMLEEYIGLADAHYQLADVEQARATYQEAMRLAQRISAPNPKRIEILHRLADIDLSRLDLRQALRNYEQIRQIDPADERTRRSLVDLHYRLNNPVEAVKELDALLRIYAQNKRGDLIVTLLEQMVATTPNDMALRSRLAAVYRQTHRNPDAIAQLDALGELQLEAGLLKDACGTVKTILTLGPTNVEQYQTLLSQLGC